MFLGHVHSRLQACEKCTISSDLWYIEFEDIAHLSDVSMTLFLRLFFLRMNELSGMLQGFGVNILPTLLKIKVLHDAIEEPLTPEEPFCFTKDEWEE